MTDDLERRLRRADPARSTSDPHLSETSIRDLMESAMRDSVNQSHHPRPARWLVAAAAGAVLVGGGWGVAGILADDPTPSAASTMELSLPDPGTMASCIPYSVDVLAEMPTAFSGEVVEAGDGTVVVQVDKWYRGGEADTVRLTSPTGDTTSIDAVEFAEDDRYLVTASEAGTVNSCGFTAPWSERMAADFEEAFSR